MYVVFHVTILTGILLLLIGIVDLSIHAFLHTTHGCGSWADTNPGLVQWFYFKYVDFVPANEGDLPDVFNSKNNQKSLEIVW